MVRRMKGLGKCSVALKSGSDIIVSTVVFHFHSPIGSHSVTPFQ